MHTQSIRFNLFPPVALVAFACLCALLLISCSGKEKLTIDISEGFATTTLKEFARQTEVEIVFDLQSVYGVKTNAVNGNYDADSALRMMLDSTPLGVDFEIESGAYAVFRK